MTRPVEGSSPDPYACAECGTTDATTYVVTTLDPDNPDTRTEVCRACDDILRFGVVIVDPCPECGHDGREHITAGVAGIVPECQCCAGELPR